MKGAVKFRQERPNATHAANLELACSTNQCNIQGPLESSGHGICAVFAVTVGSKTRFVSRITMETTLREWRGPVGVCSALGLCSLE